MRKNYLFNYFSLCSALDYYNKKYHQAAQEFVDQHNATSDDHWIFHGTYLRWVLVWDRDKQDWIKIGVKIIRIRSKAQKKTFSFQGGFFMARTKYLCMDLLTFLSASFLKKDNEGSFETFCNKYQVIPSLAKRIKSLFLTVLSRRNATWMVKSTGDPSLLARWFVAAFWHKSCNPFCSSMEANGLA